MKHGFVVLICCLLLASCQEKEAPAQSKDSTIEWAAWLPDWDAAKAISDGKQMNDALHTAILFSVQFDEEGQVKIPSNLLSLLEVTESDKTFISVVNDRVTSEKTVLKDPTLISALLADSHAQNRWIKELVELTQTYSIQGIEVDLEKVQPHQWSDLYALYQQLFMALQERGKQLRIVVEPLKTEALAVAFEGPVYSVMAYQLYGSFSGPGPKADDVFLKKVASFAKQFPGSPHVALSMGGFSWEGQDYQRAYTNEELEQLFAADTYTFERGEKAQEVIATNLNQTIVYADHETFYHWCDILKKEGITAIDIWRLGGLSKPILDQIHSMK